MSDCERLGGLGGVEGLCILSNFSVADRVPDARVFWQKKPRGSFYGWLWLWKKSETEMATRLARHVSSGPARTKGIN